jgi:deoxyribodipyrimidine photolyase-like uncharacterized protein
LLGIPVIIYSDTRFLASHDDFSAWAKGKTQLRMEFFYRAMRKTYKFLMEPDGQPTGGSWNFDRENRHPSKRGLHSSWRLSHKKSATTRYVLALVRDRFPHHFGRLEPFHYAVTRDEALKVAQMIVVANEVSDLLLEITWQVIVFEQDAVLEGLMPGFEPVTSAFGGRLREVSAQVDHLELDFGCKGSIAVERMSTAR